MFTRGQRMIKKVLRHGFNTVTGLLTGLFMGALYAIPVAITTPFVLIKALRLNYSWPLSIFSGLAASVVLAPLAFGATPLFGIFYGMINGATAALSLHRALISIVQSAWRDLVARVSPNSNLYEPVLPNKPVVEIRTTKSIAAQLLANDELLAHSLAQEMQQQPRSPTRTQVVAQSQPVVQVPVAAPNVANADEFVRAPDQDYVDQLLPPSVPEQLIDQAQEDILLDNQLLLARLESLPRPDVSPQTILLSETEIAEFKQAAVRPAHLDQLKSYENKLGQFKEIVWPVTATVDFEPQTFEEEQLKSLINASQAAGQRAFNADVVFSWGYPAVITNFIAMARDLIQQWKQPKPEVPVEETVAEKRLKWLARQDLGSSAPVVREEGQAGVVGPRLG